MGAVPKHKISTYRRGRRRAAFKLKLNQLIVCRACSKPKLPHFACPHCGQV